MLETRKPRTRVAALVLLGAAVGLSACDVVVSSVDAGRARAERSWARSYTLGDDARVEVVNVNGSVSVETGDGNALRVNARIIARGSSEEAAQATLEKIDIKEEVTGGTVRLQAMYPPQPRRSPFEVIYTIQAPRTATLDIQTVNGTISVNGAVTALSAETTNGSVEGRGLTGQVKAESTNGAIKIQMAALADGGVELETTNGSIDLQLPGDAKATLAARCVNGGINVADLPFEKTGDSARRKLDGTINGGGAAIRLETVNGRIRVSKTR